MNKVFMVLLAIITLGQTIIDSRLPDAIRCGADGSGFDGAIFFINSFKANNQIYYHQIYSPAHHYVLFHLDGGYYTSAGDYQARKGCQNKSLSTLDKQNRTIYYALDSTIRNQTELDEENAIKDSIMKLQQQSTAKDKQITSLKEEVSELKKRQQSSCANFWDYEQIKQKWLKDFRKEWLADIKDNSIPK